jgi:ABC-type Fe3+-hydroxamate transport system substrate-binding protein
VSEGAVERTDAMGERVTLAAPARRVVSLVPSETETLFALGAGDRVVGRTVYCVEPRGAVERVPTVRGTKDADLDAVAALAPDLVLANQEENTPEIVRGLRARGIAVHTSFPKTVEDAAALVRDLAALVGIDPDRNEAVRAMDEGLARAAARRARTTPVRVFCPIWMEPLMTVHGETFISDVLDLAGGANVFADRVRRYPLAADLGLRAPLPEARVRGRDVRYPRVTLDEVVARAPDVVLLPDEPHPFTEQDAAVFRALDIPAARSGRVLFVDGKDLCWYSPRMGAGVERLARVLAAVG